MNILNYLWWMFSPNFPNKTINWEDVVKIKKEQDVEHKHALKKAGPSPRLKRILERDNKE